MSTTFGISHEFSPSGWKDFLADILPDQGCWTEDEYLVVTDHATRLIEYTDGVLEPVPIPTDRHHGIVGFLFEAFLGYLDPRGGKVRFSGLRLKVRKGKFREPDLLLVLSADDPRRQKRFWTGADLALEVVSPDKPHRDLVDKRGDYAEGAVPEYWIVNPEDETISVLRLENGSYVEAGMHRRGESAASVLLAGFAVEVNDVFDAD